MFNAMPGLATRLRLCAQARGYSGTHPALVAADALDAAIASGNPAAIAAATADAECEYCKIQTGD